MEAFKLTFLLKNKLHKYNIKTTDSIAYHSRKLLSKSTSKISKENLFFKNMYELNIIQIHHSIAIIGGGNLGLSIAEELIKSNWIEPKNIMTQPKQVKDVLPEIKDELNTWHHN